MKRIKSILFASVVTLAISSNAFAGDIYGKTAPCSGDIYGFTNALLAILQRVL